MHSPKTRSAINVVIADDRVILFELKKKKESSYPKLFALIKNVPIFTNPSTLHQKIITPIILIPVVEAII